MYVLNPRVSSRDSGKMPSATSSCCVCIVCLCSRVSAKLQTLNPPTPLPPPVCVLNPRVSSRDSGKTPLEAVLGEIVVTAEKLNWLIKNGEEVLKPCKRGAGVMVRQESVPRATGCFSILLLWRKSVGSRGCKLERGGAQAL